MTLTSLSGSVTVNGKVTRTSFDKASMTITTTTPMGKAAKRAIDQQGRVTQLSVSGLLPIDYTYDIRGRMSAVTQGTRTTSYSFDAAGNLSAVTDPSGRVTTFGYDSSGRMTSQTLFDGRVVSLTYDANGNVTSITPPSRPAHGFTYTPVNMESSYNPPDIGIGNVATTYAYNLDKQIMRVTRPDGRSMNYSYDTAGRLSSIALPGSTVNYAYGAGGSCCGGGHLPVSITRETLSLNYEYDGTLLTSSTWSGAVNGSVRRGYDNSFRITSRSVNGANTVTQTYDNDGLLSSAGAMTITRNSGNGFITSSTLGGVTTAYTYSDIGEMTGYTAKLSGAVTYDTQFTRDALGRITRKVETVQGVATTFDYAYDTAGRLVGVSKNGVQISSYVYDNNSNRITATVNGVATQGFYDLQDRLTAYGNNSYTYTANGELLTKTSNGQAATYNYDALGNLLAVTMPDGTAIEYVIDGQNRRVGKKVNGVLAQGLLYRDALKPIAELDGAGNVVSVFVYGTRFNTPDYMLKNGVTYRIISDHLGSPRLIVNTADNTIAQNLEYDEWGNVTVDTAPGFQPFGFAGGIYDQHTKLTRFGARDYDAETGRWTSKDPIGFGGGDENLYGYVLGDPLNGIDTNGKYVASAAGAIGVCIAFPEICAAIPPLIYCTIFPEACGLPPHTCPEPQNPPMRSEGSEGGDEGGSESDGRNQAQDKKLTKGEIGKLENGGIDVHGEKGKYSTGQTDLYKDRKGNIYVKPKGGRGPGEPTGLNINDF